MLQTFIKERIDLLTPDYQEFLFSGYPEMTASVFAETLNLDEDGLIVFENGIVLFLLFFIDAAGLTHFLVTDCHVEPHLAEEIVASILKGLPENLLSAQTEAYTLINEPDSDLADSITESTRVAVLKQISIRKIKFFQYVHAGGKLADLAKQHNITDTLLLATFKELIGDIILGFYTVEDTIPLLEQELNLDETTAALLGVEVVNFLAPLSDPNWQPPIVDNHEVETGLGTTYTSDTVAEIENAPGTEQTQSAVRVASLQPTPNFVIPSNLQAGRVAPTPVIAVSPEIHTMASDATRARNPEQSAYAPLAIDEVVHISKQPAVRQTLSDLPAYTSGAPATLPTAPPITPEAPRWGS